MKFDPDKIIGEVDRLKKKLQNAIEENSDFKKVYLEIIDLCDIFFNRKSDYKEINISYPEDINIVIDFVDPKGKNSNKEIIAPDWSAEHRKKLAINCLSTLDRIRAKAALQSKLQSNQQESLRKEINKIKKRLKKIEC